VRRALPPRYWLYKVVIFAAQLLVSVALAQSFPNKPVRMMVGFSPGGGTDVTARLVAQKLSAQLGQSVIVENRAGASGAIAAEFVARSPADGYMLLMVASTTFINAVLRGQSLERDLTPVSLATTAPMVLVVHPSVPAHNVKELIALARTRPGKLNYGSDGVGGTTHLCGELFSLLAEVKLVHVPYKGAGDSILATASGQVDMNFASAPATLPLLGAGKFRALAVSSPQRSSLLPSLPSLDESGLVGFDVTTWFGVLAPVAVPKDIIAQLNAAIVKVVNTSEMKEAINKQGMETQANSPEQFAEFMRRQSGTIARLVEKAGMKAD
jgi:tripartite-type tricarboxylate transporter receptor subunit TctC